MEALCREVRTAVVRPPGGRRAWGCSLKVDLTRFARGGDGELLWRNHEMGVQEQTCEGGT